MKDLEKKKEMKLTVRVTVLVHEKDLEDRASFVTRTEKESFLQSAVKRYLQVPWKLNTLPSKVR